MPEPLLPQAVPTADRSFALATRAGLLVAERATDLTAAARKAAPDPSVFETNPPLFWAARFSNGNLDSYFTQMAESSLRNYAKDAAAGIAFLDSHRTDGQHRIVGRSLTGAYRDGAVEADFYGLQGVDPTADAFYAKLRGGQISDVSVGFHGGQWICSLCGRDMLTDYECPHIPGWEYDLPDAKGKPSGKREVATATIEDAHASEASGVYDGATPGAQIISVKAPRLADEGRLAPAIARSIEARFGVRIRGADHLYRGVAVPQPQEATVPEPKVPAEERTYTHTEHTAAVERAVAQRDTEHQAAVAAIEKQVAAAARALGLEAQTAEEAVAALATFAPQLTELRALADMGRAYRGDLVEEALREGVRAQGDAFPQEAYRDLLGGASLERIKAVRDAFKKAGDAQFADLPHVQGRDNRQGEAATPAATDPGAPPVTAFKTPR